MNKQTHLKSVNNKTPIAAKSSSKRKNNKKAKIVKLIKALDIHDSQETGLEFQKRVRN